MTFAVPEQPTPATTLNTLWLDITRKCPLSCSHCYNDSGPSGNHGTMLPADWFRVIEEAAACGVRRVQFIGGEPTAHPNYLGLATRALDRGLVTETYTNLVHVSPDCWEIFQRPGASLATSYYSDDAGEHAAVTGRPRSHARTRDNIKRAVQLGIPIRVGIVVVNEGQRVEAARRELESLGVTQIHVDHVRPYGRGSGGREPDASGLCGNCGTGKAAIAPDGRVSPCVFSTWMSVGSVRDASLGAIVSSSEMAQANAAIRAATIGAHRCDPDDECSPGTPLSGCNPRT